MSHVIMHAFPTFLISRLHTHTHTIKIGAMTDHSNFVKEDRKARHLFIIKRLREQCVRLRQWLLSDNSGRCPCTLPKTREVLRLSHHRLRLYDTIADTDDVPDDQQTDLFLLSFEPDSSDICRIILSPRLMGRRRDESEPDSSLLVVDPFFCISHHSARKRNELRHFSP